MGTATVSPVQKRVLQSFDGVIYLEDYIWVMKSRPKDKRPHYGHALMVYYWQNERLLEDTKYHENVQKVKEILAYLERKKKAQETSNNPGNTS